MGWFSDIVESVSDFVEDSVKLGGELVAAPVRFAGETIRGENPLDNVVDLGKKTAGITIRAGTYEPLWNIQATRDLMRDETVDRLTLGFGDKFMTSVNITDKLSDGREIEQHEWEAARQLGTAAAAVAAGGYLIGEGAVLVGEAQSAASVGGWAFELPSIGLTDVAAGSLIYNAVSRGDYQGAAQALGIPTPLAGLLPGNNNNQTRPPNTVTGPAPNTGVTSPWTGYGPTTTTSYAPASTGSNTQTLMMVAGLGLAIGIAYLAARRK